MIERFKWSGLILLFAAVTSCRSDPVDWQDVVYEKAGPTPAANARSVSVADSAACSSSIATAEPSQTTYAVWWSIRSDSSSILKISRRTAGNAFTRAVDTTDKSRRGCNRPAPAITVQKDNGNIHIVYYLEPAPGPGLFFAHSMDSGKTFHDQVAVAYGRHPSGGSIAAEGDRVAVAYEEPNAARGEIWVALSKSMGHLFENRMRVSSGDVSASNPAANLSGTKLEVEWDEKIERDSGALFRRARRVGIWK